MHTFADICQKSRIIIIMLLSLDIDSYSHFHVVNVDIKVRCSFLLTVNKKIYAHLD